MMENIHEKIKAYAISTFYIVLIVGSIIFILNYGFTDWETIGDEFSKSMDDAVRVLHCEIDYKEFHFKGMCSDNEIIFDFLNEIERTDHSCSINDTRWMI